MVRFVFEVQEVVACMPLVEDDPLSGSPDLRIAMHCGPAIFTVMGTIERRYSLLGGVLEMARRLVIFVPPSGACCSNSCAHFLQKHDEQKTLIRFVARKEISKVLNIANKTYVYRIAPRGSFGLRREAREKNEGR